MSLPEEIRFWAGGLDEFLDSLDREERSRESEIKALLKAAVSPAEREKLENRLTVLQKRFREKRRAASQCLFWGT